LELHKLAERCMRRQSPEHTLQTTALVHEAYLKLAGHAPRTREERSQFLAMAARTMRHVLVDHARSRGRQKRTPPGRSQALEQIEVCYEQRAVDLLALHEALERLAGFDPQMAKLVELRFFGGLSMQECAELMDEPLRTLERGWQTTRAWLAAEME
jgi:RNA polymerase sigma factor (TIGR02999 family)